MNNHFTVFDGHARERRTAKLLSGQLEHAGRNKLADFFARITRIDLVDVNLICLQSFPSDGVTELSRPYNADACENESEGELPSSYQYIFMYIMPYCTAQLTPEHMQQLV